MNRKRIGVVGVDSGQLLLIDPCYIDNEWEREGKVVGIMFWGNGKEQAKEILQERGYNVTPKNTSHIAHTNDLQEIEKIEQILNKASEP
jgi:hypothetical protein